MSLLDRFWNEVRISLMGNFPVHAALCKLYFFLGDGSVGLKLPPRFPNMQSEHGLQAKEGEEGRRGFFVFCGYRPRLRLPSSVIDS